MNRLRYMFHWLTTSHFIESYRVNGKTLGWFCDDCDWAVGKHPRGPT
jgi:hypothetical protein